jgi:hypothetical protein
LHRNRLPALNPVWGANQLMQLKFALVVCQVVIGGKQKAALSLFSI